MAKGSRTDAAGLSVHRERKKGRFARDFTLKDQIKRASISSASNIAEGFDRGGNREFIQFLSTAKGSVSEVKSKPYAALDAAYIIKMNSPRYTNKQTAMFTCFAGISSKRWTFAKL